MIKKELKMKKLVILALVLISFGCASNLKPIYPGFPGISTQLPDLAIRGIGEGETRQAACLKAWAEYSLSLSRMAIIDLSLTTTGKGVDSLASLIQLKTAVPSFEKIKVEYARFGNKVVCQIYTTFRSVAEREKFVKKVYDDLRSDIAKWHKDQLNESQEEMDWRRFEGERRKLNQSPKKNRRIIPLPQIPIR